MDRPDLSLRLTPRGWAQADGVLGNVLLGPVPCQGCRLGVVYRAGIGWCNAWNDRPHTCIQAPSRRA